ncbi:MAG: phosphatidate cytidylyltransferase [Chlorobiaceae bacterium]|nr:phosphatidate cytidylyltransferase [Chlorobiaceae bacterium]
MSNCLKTGKVEHNQDRLDFRYEFARKAIHLSSLLIPLIYCRISRELALTILIPMTAGFLSVDILKNFVPAVSVWYHGTFAPMLRQHELQKDRIHLNGATWITLSAFILIALFPKMIAVTAFAMVSISDTMAALVGKRFGRHRFGEKSYEGSLAFFASAVAIAAAVPHVLLPAGLAMAAAGTIAEAVVIRIGGFKIDDNISVPLAAAVAGLCCYLWFFPSSMSDLATCF